jgi:integrase
MRNSTVCTRHGSLKLFFAFLEDEDDLPSPMSKVRRPTEQDVSIQPLTEDQLAALLNTCKGRDFESCRDSRSCVSVSPLLSACPRSPYYAWTAPATSPTSRSPGCSR